MDASYRVVKMRSATSCQNTVISILYPNRRENDEAIRWVGSCMDCRSQPIIWNNWISVFQCQLLLATTILLILCQVWEGEWEESNRRSEQFSCWRGSECWGVWPVCWSSQGVPGCLTRWHCGQGWPGGGEVSSLLQRWEYRGPGQAGSLILPGVSHRGGQA